MNVYDESLRLHEKLAGKLEITSRAGVGSKEELSLAYTPGVAQPCLAIQENPDLSYTLTRRHNLCLVVTDGSAVLGLGDIGPLAGMPVMEGKCVLFKEFGGVDAFPLCVNSKDIDTFVETVYQISGSFGGINLEDIAAPRCFEIERRLKERCDIPVFHDDQHGTAVVVLAGLLNAVKVVGKKREELKIVLNGAGAAGLAVARLLISAGFENITLCDINGIICEGVPALNTYQDEMAALTNREKKQGSLADALKGADVFLGFSKGGLLNAELVGSMAKDSIIFACANPVPEIMPEEAKAAGAAVVASGRSDCPNQINNVLVFPGLFRGAFDVRAKEINEEMKLAAAQALAQLVSDKLSADYIIPEPFDPRVKDAVAKAVSEAAKNSGAARI